jgi:hypothetical protein
MAIAKLDFLVRRAMRLLAMEVAANEAKKLSSDAVGNPTHLYISYATEDIALATWLARKLAAVGYAVWFDKLKLLWGEPWPQSIDDAIKHRTFRMFGADVSTFVFKTKSDQRAHRGSRCRTQKTNTGFSYHSESG